MFSDNVTSVIPENFLPFGPMYGDTIIPPVDDGSSEEIQLGYDVIIFGTRNDRLYVSLNCIVSDRFFKHEQNLSYSCSVVIQIRTKSINYDIFLL